MTRLQKYIEIKQLADFHGISTSLIMEFAEFGLIEISYKENTPCIYSRDVEKCERAIRLYKELGINKEGIDIILDLRERIEVMQQELNRLRHQLKKHEERRSVFFRDEFFDAD